MKYTEEDYNYINNCLDKCVKIEHNNIIYYVTSPNILRQLKYNQLLSKKGIKIDLSKINYKDNVILEQELKTKSFWINYHIIWSIFKSKYNYNNQETKELINDILCDILNLKEEYTTKKYFFPPTYTLYELLNLKEYIIHNHLYNDIKVIV